MSSVPTFFFFLTYTLNYTSSQVVEYCSLNKASVYPFFNHTQEFLRKWSQIMIRKPSYLNHIVGLNFFCFQFQRILCLKNLITSKSITKNESQIEQMHFGQDKVQSSRKLSTISETILSQKYTKRRIEKALICLIISWNITLWKLPS